MDQGLKRKNTRTLLLVASLVLIMAAAAFASVPMYNLFCRVTGFGGTPQISRPDIGSGYMQPESAIGPVIKVNFMGRTAPDLPWRFTPDLRSLDVRPGQQALVSFTARNLSARPSTGTAVYNVTPAKAGKYFNKVQCFCFTGQTIPAAGAVNMPVVFYIDPAIRQDRSMEEVRQITLSYVFYKQDTPRLEKALDEFEENALE